MIKDERGEKEGEERRKKEGRREEGGLMRR